MKKMINKILYPNTILSFFIFNFGFGLLIYIFSNHLEDSFLAYISYALSFYALIIFCIWFYKACKVKNESIKKSKIHYLYQKHSLVVVKASLYSSLVFNLIYGIFKPGIGIYYTSWWFITFAVYYLLLCILKLSLVMNIEDNNSKKSFNKLKHTGIILLFLNLILIGIIILIIKQDRIVHYHGFIIYMVALYDFYLIISAIIKVFKYKKEHSPIIISRKCINLTVAMISMVSLEVAMISQFGDNDSHFKFMMTSLMGFAICVINSFMAICMIRKANKHLH